MADVEEVNTDRGRALQPPGPRKSQKAIALNILITVDKENQGKGEKKCCPCPPPPENNNACCQKPKKCCRKHEPTCGDPGASVPPPCLPPNSMVLPCGCLAMFDDAQSRFAAENMLGLRRSNNAGTQCASKPTTDRGVCGKQEKQCASAGCQTITRTPSVKDHVSEHKRHYGHRKVQRSRSRTTTAAGSQTPATSIPKTKERMKTSSRTDLRSRSSRQRLPTVKKSASQTLLEPSTKYSQTTATQTSFSQEPPAKAEPPKDVAKAVDTYVYEAPPKEPVPKESEKMPAPEEPAKEPKIEPVESVPVVPSAPAPSENVVVVAQGEVGEVVPSKEPSVVPLNNAAPPDPSKVPSAVPAESAVAASPVPPKEPSTVAAPPDPPKEPSAVPLEKPASPVASKKPSAVPSEKAAAPPPEPSKEPSAVPLMSVEAPYQASEVEVPYVPSEASQKPIESAKGSQTNIAKGSQTNLTKQASQTDMSKASQSKITEVAPKGSQTNMGPSKTEVPKEKSAMMVGYVMIENDPETEASTKPSTKEIEPPQAESTAAVKEPEPPAPSPAKDEPSAAVSPSLPHFSKMGVNVPDRIDVSGGDYQAVDLDELLKNAQKDFADVRAIASTTARRSIDRQQGGFPPPPIEFSRTASRQNTVNYSYGDDDDEDEDRDREDDEEREEGECDQEEEEDYAEEECDDENADDEGGFSLSKMFDWNTWDRFVSLMNGEPIPNPCMNRCEEDPDTECSENEEEEEQTGCSEEEEEACSDGDGWTGRRRSSSSDRDRIETLSLMLQSDTASQDTYILFIALPLVILGLMASFKQC